jgi:hypothetical protein
MGFPGNRLSVIDINWPWLIANCRLVKVGLGVPWAFIISLRLQGSLTKSTDCSGTSRSSNRFFRATLATTIPSSSAVSRSAISGGRKNLAAHRRSNFL